MRVRRQKPSTDEERKRASELRSIIGNARTAKAEREAAQLELDVLAPPLADTRTPAQRERRAHYLRLRLSAAASLSPSRQSRMQNELVELTGSLSGVRGEKEEGLSDRSPVSPQSKPTETFSVSDFEAGLARLAIEDRAKAIRKAANATPAEKAEVILSELPNHPLNKLAAEVVQWLLNEDRSNPKPPATTLAANYVRHWLSDEPWNRWDARGSRVTVDAAVGDALRLVAERDVAEPNWFVRRAEKILDAPPAIAKPIVSSQATHPQKPVETLPVSDQPEPVLNPVGSADMAARSALVLQTDSWLSRLAEHSPDMHTRILASLSDELLRVGFVSGDFCARLYNDSRPRALSQFRPRQF